ncbi:MAG: L,D-transpeptidase family protein [Granulosicoccus sp.]
MKHCLIVCLLLCPLSVLQPAIAAPHLSFEPTAEMDKQTRAVLNSMVRGDIDTAETLARQLATRFPQFALGQLLHAELESVAAGDGVRAAEGLKWSQTLRNLLLEAKTRLAQQPLEQRNFLPNGIIQLGQHVSHAIVVDLAASRLYLYDNQDGVTTLIREHYIASGSAGFGKKFEGDMKTPLGVYSISGVRTANSLPDLYGAGALTLDYPNPLDKLQGRTGSGIWLHGIPSGQRSRSPRSSEGCVTMANDYLSLLQEEIDPNRTTVILTRDIQWSSTVASLDERERFIELFEQFRKAWVNTDTDELAALYMLTALPESLKTMPVQPGSGRQQVAHRSMPGRSGHSDALQHAIAEDVSLIYNPFMTAETSHKPYLIMSIGLNVDHSNETRLTLYWSESADGQWRIAHERLSGNET